MGFNLGKSISVFNTLRLSPGKMAEEMKKKFKLVVTGSRDWSNAFYEVLSTGANMDVPAAEHDKKLKEFIEVVSLPQDEEDCRQIKSDLIICTFKQEDLIEDNLLKYKTLYKMRPPAICFIEEPVSENKKFEIQSQLDYLFISNVQWIQAPTEEAIGDVAETILKINKRYDLPLAYRFPILREKMAKNLIHSTGAQNMIIALASSLPTNLPIIGVIIGLLAVAGETTVLTVNQIKLCMQLAGLYGLELNLIDRIKELWPLVGTALGFRAIARSLVGFIPLAGPTIKGAIAYGGTQLVGETVRWYYQEGKTLNPEEKKKIYDEAKEKALNTAKKYLEKFKSKAGKPAQESGKEELDFDNIEDGIDQLEKEITRLEEEMNEESLKTIDTLVPPPPKETEEEPEEVRKRAVVKEAEIKPGTPQEPKIEEKKHEKPMEKADKKLPVKAKPIVKEIIRNDLPKDAAPAIIEVKRKEPEIVKPVKQDVKAQEVKKQIPPKPEVKKAEPVKPVEKVTSVEPEKKETVVKKKPVSKPEIKQEVKAVKEPVPEKKPEVKAPPKTEQVKEPEKIETKVAKPAVIVKKAEPKPKTQLPAAKKGEAQTVREIPILKKVEIKKPEPVKAAPPKKEEKAEKQENQQVKKVKVIKKVVTKKTVDEKAEPNVTESKKPGEKKEDKK